MFLELNFAHSRLGHLVATTASAATSIAGDWLITLLTFIPPNLSFALEYAISTDLSVSRPFALAAQKSPATKFKSPMSVSSVIVLDNVLFRYQKLSILLY